MAKFPIDITAQAWVVDFLAQPLLARLATADPLSGQPHVVPVWYEWDGEYLYISAFKSTRKIRELERNPRISVVVDVMDDANHNRAVLFEGSAEILADPSVVAARSTSLYARYLGEEGIRAAAPASWIVDPENRIIRLKPEKVFAWNG